MLARLRRHARHNVVAYIALFIALGGTAAYADNEIFSKNIVNGEVKNEDLASPSVGSGKIYDGAVQKDDLAPNAVETSKVANGTLTGLDIQDGGVKTSDIGSGQVKAGNLGTLVKRTSPHVFLADQTAADGKYARAIAHAECKRGERLLSGGGGWYGSPPAKGDLLITNSFPYPDNSPTEWRAGGTNDTGHVYEFAAVALCLKPLQLHPRPPH